VSNASVVTFGPFSSAVAISGIAVFDGLTGGNLLWSGPLLTARSVSAGYVLALPASALVVTLS
jgi:hypothetical protein